MKNEKKYKIEIYIEKDIRKKEIRKYIIFRD